MANRYSQDADAVLQVTIRRMIVDSVRSVCSSEFQRVPLSNFVAALAQWETMAASAEDALATAARTRDS